MTRATCLLLLLTCVGCASLDPELAFQTVRRDVAERTGYLVQWNRGTDADRAVTARIDKLLEQGLTVDQAVQVALLNNRNLQAEYQRLGIAQANLVQAGLLKNPVLDVTFRFAERVNDGVLEFAVVQDFMNVLMVPLRKRVARAELARTRLEVTARVVDLAARTRLAALEVQAAAQQLKLRRVQLEATRARYDMAGRLHEAGNIKDLDLATHRAVYEQTKLVVARAETRLDQLRDVLSALMGLYGQRTQWTLREDLPEVPTGEQKLDDLESRAVRGNLHLAALEQAMRAEAARTGIEISETAFPELALGGEVEREPGNHWSGGPTFGVAIPVFDWGQARSAAGRAMLMNLWQRYTARAIDLRSAVRSAGRRLENARAASRHIDEVVVPLQSRIMQEVQLQYNAMQLGTFRLLAARRMEIEARLQGIAARRDYWRMRTRLEQILAGVDVPVESLVTGAAGASPGMGEGGGH